MRIKDAKIQYIKTGRLNQNVVSKEIAISWYKCKLQNMEITDSIKLSKHDVNNQFSSAFMNYIDSIVSEAFQYVLANTKLQVCKSRVYDSKLSMINSIDDLLIGTNGGYNASKNHRVQIVSKDEHYLDDLTNYYSIGIPIIVEEKYKGTLMILSDQMPSEYEIANIKEKLVRYYSKDTFHVTEDNKNDLKPSSITLDMLFTYPTDYWTSFKLQLDNLTKSLLPRVIIGSEGCGKTTLAWYLGMERGKPYYIDMQLLHPLLQQEVLENALYHNDTVIVDNIEYCSKQCATLLTVYTDKIIESIKKNDSSKFKCSNLYLTTAYSTLTKEKKEESHKIISTLIDKLRISSLHMVNLNNFDDQYAEIVENMISRNHNNMQISKDLLKSRYTTFKALVQAMSSFGTSSHQMNAILSLEAYEKAYIMKVYNELNGNVTLASEVLGIGRSTLYRKLEKYQNETER